MASMRDIKRRKVSIQSTGQITKAMKLVSTVKLQKGKYLVENFKPYFNYMYSEVRTMIHKSESFSHPFLNQGDTTKKAIILISSNRGLAGGYNSNLVKLITNGKLNKEDILIYGVGRKGLEQLARRGYYIKADYSEAMNAPIFKDAAEIGKEVLDAYTKGEISEIYLAYTVFRNTVSHIPTMIKLLPVNEDSFEGEEDTGIGTDADTDTDKLTLMNYEPGVEEVLSFIIPKYMNSLIYGALIEAYASENGARIQAMDTATNNAQDMIRGLELKYNRARQGSITQELTEIVAGANAIG